VARHRARLPAAAPPGELQPQPEVDVLQIGAEALVEAAHRPDGGAPVQRSARAGGEHLTRRVVAARVALEAPALLAHAVPPQDVAGVVEHVRVREVEHLRRDRRGLRRGRERGDGALEPARIEQDVGVDQRDRLGADRRDPRVGGAGEPAVDRAGHHAHARIALRQQRQRPVRRAVVDDDHLGGRQRLRGHAVEHAGEPALAVVVGDHHRRVHERRRYPLSRR
jgi:hypothetical protein